MSPSDPPTTHRITYVCKMYPRFSETFVVSELLGREAAGEDLDLVSLRPPADGRFHEQLARVRAPVTYLEHRGIRAGDLWDALAAATDRGDDVAGTLDALLAVGTREASQALALAAHVHERGTTHLHAHFGSVATTVTRLAAKLTGTTYSFTAHAKDIFHEEVDDADLAVKLADAHHVVTVSDHNVRHLQERFGAAADGVARVYNGLEIDAFPYTAPDGSRPGEVVAVGRLVEKKGFDVLLDALARIRSLGRQVHATIVGTGVLEDELHRRADALDLLADGTVRFLGACPAWQVRELVAEARVMAAPCVVAADGNADGLPTTVLESMALGTPVVATDVTGLPEVVHHESTGLQVPQHDADALADALVRVLDDDALRVRLAEAGRALVEQRFTSAVQAAGLRALLPELPVAAPAERTQATPTAPAVASDDVTAVGVGRGALTEVG